MKNHYLDGEVKLFSNHKIPEVSMEKGIAQKNKLNRRRAFRIYEQVDLCFHKIDGNLESNEKHEFNDIINKAFHPQPAVPSHAITASTFDQTLPDSQSKENDTLNVNISSSGISFTCKKELMAGDYLMMRVLLLSSMTIIMTCCKVVYCKPSNPFENDQYPYTAGAQFINLREDDKALLNKHIKKKRTQQFIVSGLLASLIMTVLVLPDIVFDLLLDSFYMLVENTLETAYFLNELIGYSLDRLVEFFFYTDFRTTQIISFYIQIFLGLIVLYAFIRVVPGKIVRLFSRFISFCYGKKSSFFYYWGEQNLLKKTGIISIGVIVIFCYGLLFV